MKMIMMLALLFACGAAQASDWVLVTKDEKTGERFIDVSSIAISTEIRRVWVKTILPPDKPLTLERMDFNCGEGTMRWETSTLYLSEGHEINDPVGTPPTPWQPVRPDTIGSALMQFVCAWKPK